MECLTPAASSHVFRILALSLSTVLLAPGQSTFANFNRRPEGGGEGQ